MSESSATASLSQDAQLLVQCLLDAKPSPIPLPNDYQTIHACLIAWAQHAPDAPIRMQTYELLERLDRNAYAGAMTYHESDILKQLVSEGKFRLLSSLQGMFASSLMTVGITNRICDLPSPPPSAQLLLDQCMSFLLFHVSYSIQTRYSRPRDDLMDMEENTMHWLVDNMGACLSSIKHVVLSERGYVMPEDEILRLYEVLDFLENNDSWFSSDTRPAFGPHARWLRAFLFHHHLSANTQETGKPVPPPFM